MGEAYDRTGHMLGSAQGETKREVLDKLQERFPDAHEIRIRTAGASDPPLSDHAQSVKRMMDGEQAMKDTMPATSNAKPLDDEPMLKWFAYRHLPEALQGTSKMFCDVAGEIVRTQRRTPERTVCLRKLLEAKDAAVRNALP